jgi:hypothetical protein
MKWKKIVDEKIINILITTSPPAKLSGLEEQVSAHLQYWVGQIDQTRKISEPNGLTRDQIMTLSISVRARIQKLQITIPTVRQDKIDSYVKSWADYFIYKG